MQALDNAIAQGALIVEYADKRVQYRSLDEMLRVRRLMAEELGLNKPARSRKYGEFNKGLK